jgi:hypothetical protein
MLTHAAVARRSPPPRLPELCQTPPACSPHCGQDGHGGDGWNELLDFILDALAFPVVHRKTLWILMLESSIEEGSDERGWCPPEQNQTLCTNVEVPKDLFIDTDVLGGQELLVLAPDQPS